jgi:glycine cleavage system H lipoate-binding protein
MSTKIQKPFKVASVSSNANSFGLHGHVLVAKDGTAFEVGITGQFKLAKGDIIEVECHTPGNFMNWQKNSAGVTIEIPRALGKAPAAAVKEVWK